MIEGVLLFCAGIAVGTIFGAMVVGAYYAKPRPVKGGAIHRFPPADPEVTEILPEPYREHGYWPGTEGHGV